MLLAAATTALSAPASEPDPLNSSECKAAREKLEHILKDAPAGSQQASQEKLALARKQAALSCLGRASTGQERSGTPTDPVQVAAPPRPPPSAPMRAISPAPPLSAPPRAAAITICDPAGCWDSEGRRLNNVGPFLMGPHGLCTVQGGLVNCP